MDTQVQEYRGGGGLIIHMSIWCQSGGGFIIYVQHPDGLLSSVAHNNVH